MNFVCSWRQFMLVDRSMLSIIARWILILSTLHDILIHLKNSKLSNFNFILFLHKLQSQHFLYHCQKGRLDKSHEKTLLPVFVCWLQFCLGFLAGVVPSQPPIFTAPSFNFNKLERHNPVISPYLLILINNQSSTSAIYSSVIYVRLSLYTPHNITTCLLIDSHFQMISLIAS